MFRAPISIILFFILVALACLHTYQDSLMFAFTYTQDIFENICKNIVGNLKTIWSSFLKWFFFLLLVILGTNHSGIQYPLYRNKIPRNKFYAWKFFCFWLTYISRLVGIFWVSIQRKGASSPLISLFLKSKSSHPSLPRQSQFLVHALRACSALVMKLNRIIILFTTRVLYFGFHRKEGKVVELQGFTKKGNQKNNWWIN